MLFCKKPPVYSSLLVNRRQSSPVSTRRTREKRAPLPRHRQEMSSSSLYGHRKRSPGRSSTAASQRAREVLACLLVDKKREMSSLSFLLLLQKIEDRPPLTFKRRAWSCPQPSTRNEQLSTLASGTSKKLLQVTLGKRKVFSKGFPLALGESSFHLKRNEGLPLLAREDRAPPAYKKKRRASPKFMRKKTALSQKQTSHRERPGPPRDIRGKRRELLARSELHYRLVSREKIEETWALVREDRIFQKRNSRYL